MIFQKKANWLLFLACAIGTGCSSDSAKLDDEAVIGAEAGLAAEPAEELIRNSLLSYYTSTGAENGLTGGVSTDANGVSESAAPLADSADGASGSAASSRFSDTNVQEAGVDESDRIKIDGDVLYALETPDLNYIDYGAPVPEGFLSDVIAPPYLPSVETLSAYRLDGDNSSVISRLQLQELSGRSISGMYLYKSSNETDLILLSGQSFFPWDSWGRASDFGGLETRISWIDADNPQALSTQRTMDIQGHLIASRRVDNRLILVTRFHPQINGVVPYAYTEEDINRNRELIVNADVSEFLPVVRIAENGSATQRPVIGSNLCFRTTSDDQNSDDAIAGSSFYNPSPSIISIISVDLDNLSTGINSACFIGDSETLYVSPESVYLATTEYNYLIADASTTDREIVTDTDIVENSVDQGLFDAFYAPEVTTNIHKFTFTNAGAPVFRGSGSVKGHLGWNPDRKPFRFSEKDNNLRVVTFDESLPESPVTLSILQESGGRLIAVSTLPNETRPAPIGKPGESLYASRFIGDRAYLVTFRIVDPLYVLDLSNPRDPRIAGELEIPGYSDYLHPVNDSLLIGLGKDAVEATSSFFGDGRGAWYQGVKIALYDVADPANPFVADERVYGKRGTESPALLQHHSFAFLDGDEGRNFKLSIPLSLNNGSTNGSLQTWAPWTSNNLLSLEVDENSNRFVDVPGWELESRNSGFRYSPVGLENDRAVIGANNDLYLIHNGTLHYGDWGSSEPSLSINN